MWQWGDALASSSEDAEEIVVLSGSQRGKIPAVAYSAKVTPTAGVLACSGPGLLAVLRSK